MTELREALNLERPPARIECYDISHTQGTNTVGSMVVFVQGAPRKSDYRRFNVRTVGNDDYGAMKEVLTRRFQRYADSMAGELHDPAKIGKTRKDIAWSILPDLLLVDGGKGQLSMAKEVLQEFKNRRRSAASGSCQTRRGAIHYSEKIASTAPASFRRSLPGSAPSR